jgi:hypothetical protein
MREDVVACSARSNVKRCRGVPFPLVRLGHHLITPPTGPLLTMPRPLWALMFLSPPSPPPRNERLRRTFMTEHNHQDGGRTAMSLVRHGYPLLYAVRCVDWDLRWPFLGSGHTSAS